MDRRRPRRPGGAKRRSLGQSPPILSTPQKFDEPGVAQHLQLLPHFLPHVHIARIEPPHVLFEPIDISDLELSAPDCFNAVHDFDQPPPRCGPLVTQEASLPSAFEHQFLRHQFAIAYDRNSTRVGHLVQQDVAPNPSGTLRGRCERRPLLDDLGNKEVLRDHR